MDRQARAVYREHREALEDGAWELAERIERANPDLFPTGRAEVANLLPPSWQREGAYA